MKTFTNFFIFILLIALSTSSYSQIEWTKDPANPVMTGGDEGSWNLNIMMPCVLYNPDSVRYEMWFGANKGYTANNWRPYTIGYAVSDDGINWNMHDSPVLTPTEGKWDDLTVEAQCVLHEEGIYKMWYTGWNLVDDSAGIGYATSTDGITWTKHSSIVLPPGTDEWEELNPYSCSVVPYSEGYKMWYAGSDLDMSEWNIGYATSTDGINWTRDTANNPVLRVGDDGSWDDYAVSGPNVHLINDTYYMWYMGMNSTTQIRQIGLAWSEDGLTWTKYNDPETTSGMYGDSDPVLKPTPGAWDGSQVEGVNVCVIDNALRMWYDGWQSPSPPNLHGIGHATPFVVGIKDLDNTYIPKRYSLSQNYPNPFNPRTVIRYALPAASRIDLSIYNLLGEKVATLVSERQLAGQHQVKWDASAFPSGVYLYRLDAGDFIETKKLLLIK